MDLSKTRVLAVHLLSLSLLLIFSGTCVQSHEEGSISVLVSEKGLDFGKDVIIRKAISYMLPLHLEDIEKHVKIPVVGKVRIALSNITLYSLNISNSEVETGEAGIFLFVTGASANVSMRWAYSYRTWLVPVEISDDGNALVRVEGLDVKTVFSLEEVDGSLHLSLMACSCHVEDIFIDLDGGASWLYQGIVDAFGSRIRSAVEKAISKEIKEKTSRLDSILEALPKQIEIDEYSSMNITFVGNPLVGKSSITVDINGLLLSNGHLSTPPYLQKALFSSLPHESLPKMAKISVKQKVFNSASQLYFKARRMQWIVDEVPNQSILTTKYWKHILPELFQKYPNDKMQLNVSVTSPPVIHIIPKSVKADILLEATISVLDSHATSPVTCLAAVIKASGAGKISKNRLIGSTRLIGFDALLKWSRIGDIGTNAVQTAMSKILEAVFFPYVNARLNRGFPLPLILNFSVEDTDVVITESEVLVYTDISYLTAVQKPQTT